MASKATSLTDITTQITRPPGDPALHFAAATAHLAQNQKSAAATALQTCVRLNPRHDRAWQMLAELRRAAGDTDGATQAQAKAETIHATAPALRQAMAASKSGKSRAAEQILRHLRTDYPADSVTLRLLADICERSGRADEAEALVAEALRAGPDCDSTLHHQAILFYRHNKLGEARNVLQTLQKRDPRNPAYRSLSAHIQTQLGEAQTAAETYQALLEEAPGQPQLWRSLGHARKALGDIDGAAAAYHKAWQQKPDFASACWALANLKTFRFSQADTDRMLEMTQTRLPRTEACALHFALGKAFSDDGDYPAAFQHYERGNSLRRAGTPYSADRTHQLGQELASLPAPDTSGKAASGPTPIFIVGLPRAGSTLLEQMLASHSAIEGTMELPDMPMLARKLCGPDVPLAGHYAEKIRKLTDTDTADIGRAYLTGTQIQRHTEKPFFIDKRPDNFFHIPLILRALPGAKIIDIRRHPMACGFSCYSQLFSGGHAFSYDLNSIGRYYADYRALMAAFDATSPGALLSVCYEDLVADPEREIRRALSFCGLDFEDACLSFYQNHRTVRTASAAQVRRPVYTSGLEFWRHFKDHLTPLAAALPPTT